MFLEDVGESLIDGAFHYDVQVQQIVEVAVNLDDVGVVEIALNFYLSDELFHHVLVSNVLFGQYFDGAGET